jgi:toxin-antitoxin system, antitoxin component, hicB family
LPNKIFFTKVLEICIIRHIIVIYKEVVMAKYIYPAVFTKEVEGGYSVNFPDVPSCYTCGENLYDAIKMAKDVLALILYDLEQDRKEIPIASDIKDIITKKDEFVSLIAADTIY